MGQEAFPRGSGRVKTSRRKCNIRPDRIGAPLLGPLHGNLVIPGEALNPLIVIDSALAQDLLGDGPDPVHVAKEVYDVFLPSQQRQIAPDDDAVETVVYKGQQATKQPDKIFHRSTSSLALASTTRALDRGPMEIKRKISNIFA